MKKKKILFLLFGIFLLCGILIGVPFFIDSKHPRPRPSAEAWENLRTLSFLENEYYAQKGRYAPNPDGTVYYKEGNTSMQNVFPYLRPGTPKDLNFEYELTASEKGTKFLATATGKKGTKVEGETYTINHDNVKNW